MSNAVYPGLVKSHLMREAIAPIRWITSLISAMPEKAAQSVVYAALSPEVEGRTGLFLKGRRIITSSPYTHDPAVQKRLWEASLALTHFEQENGLTCLPVTLVGLEIIERPSVPVGSANVPKTPIGSWECLFRVPQVYVLSSRWIFMASNLQSASG